MSEYRPGKNPTGVTMGKCSHIISTQLCYLHGWKNKRTLVRICFSRMKNFVLKPYYHQLLTRTRISQRLFISDCSVPVQF